MQYSTVPVIGPDVEAAAGVFDELGGGPVAVREEMSSVLKGATPTVS